MSLFALCTGTLISDPQQRTSAKGSAFVTATLRVASDDSEAVLVSVIAFSKTAVDALLAHAKGDSIAITGRAKLTSWAGRDGQQNHGLSVVVEAVLTPYAVEMKRKKLTPAADSRDEKKAQPKLAADSGEPFPAEAGDLSETPF